MAIPKRDITAERLREVLDYNPDTGIFTWRIKRPGRQRPDRRAGNSFKDGYVRINLDGRLRTAGPLAWLWMLGRWPTHQIDHEDRNKANNRWSNLREATAIGNCANRGKYCTNTSGHRGVRYYAKRPKPWRADIQPYGEKIVHIGHFSTFDEAVSAYDKAATKRYGEFYKP